MSTPTIDAARVIADLRELDLRTGGPEGARRVCWTEEWVAARDLLRELLAELGIEAEQDAAGNLWASLEGDAEPALGLGSHLDSVPAGGWLDGAYGVMAALGVLRGWAEHDARPPRTLTLIDWADEEGARFGRSLFGSSAFSGSLDPAELEGLRDADGRAIAEVLAEHGVELARVGEAAGDPRGPPPTSSSISSRDRYSSAKGLRPRPSRAAPESSACASPSPARRLTRAPPRWRIVATPAWRRPRPRSRSSAPRRWRGALRPPASSDCVRGS